MLGAFAFSDPSHVSGDIHFSHSFESPHASILGGPGELGAPEKLLHAKKKLKRTLSFNCRECQERLGESWRSDVPKFIL